MLKKITGILCCATVSYIFLLAISHSDRVAVATKSDSLKITPEKQIVVLDPGHGGEDGRCTSINGKNEKDINLAVSNNLRDMLNVMGLEVKCTRTTDISIYDKGVKGTRKQKLSDMKNRLALFNKYKDGISISIHQNQFTDSKYSGAQMFYSKKNPQGEHLALCMQKQFVKNLQPENKRETKGVDDELYLLDNTSCPSIMAECGFLSNREEANLLESDDYQKQVSFTLMTGIFEYMAETPE